MQVAFGVHATQVIADDDRPARKALRELVLLPDRRAGRLVEGLDSALVVGDVKVAVVEREATEGAEVARPGQRAALRVEARDSAEVSCRADLALVDHRQARDIGDALELGRALGRDDVALPGKRARRDVDPQQLPARRPREKPAAAHNAAGVTAHGERRRRALVDPFARSVGFGQTEDPAVERPDDHRAVRWLRRTADLARNLRLPQRLATRVEPRPSSRRPRRRTEACRR